MLSLLAEIEARGSGANTGAVVGGFALLALWLAVVVVQILRHRKRQATKVAERSGRTEDQPPPTAEDAEATS